MILLTDTMSILNNEECLESLLSLSTSLNYSSVYITAHYTCLYVLIPAIQLENQCNAVEVRITILVTRSVLSVCRDQIVLVSEGLELIKNLILTTITLPAIEHLLRRTRSILLQRFHNYRHQGYYQHTRLMQLIIHLKK